MRKPSSTDLNTEKNQMVELSDKNFKETIIKVLQQAILNFVETNEKVENISKDVIF